MKPIPAIERGLNCLAFWLAIFVLSGCGSQAPDHAIVTAQGDRVNIPLAAINDDGVHFFTFKHDGKNVNFFVRTDGTGHLQAHFDACYSCYKYKLGYVREGDQMVCIACRLGYHLDDVVWDYIGACAPIQLNSTITGDHLVIQLFRLIKGSRFF